MHQQSIRPLAVATALLITLAFTAWLTWPALSGPFLFDDFPNLTHLRRLGSPITLESILDYLGQARGVPGRPLSMLSFMLNDTAWPSDPWSFKYTNLMLHLLNGILVFGLTRCIAEPLLGRNQANVAALMTTAGWLLHPLQLSASMLVVQRMTLLSAMFSIAGLWGYASLARRSKDLRSAAMAIVTLGVGTVLSTLSKENGALTPLFAVIINSTLMSAVIQGKPMACRRLLLWGSAVPVLLLAAAMAYQSDRLLGGYVRRDFDMFERLLTQGRILVDYTAAILLPRLGGGGLYHDDFTVSRGFLSPPSTLLSWLFITTTLTLAIRHRRKYPLPAFAVLWFLGGHSIESTVFPLELYFEHRNYLPMLGPLLAVASLAVSSPRPFRATAFVGLSCWLALTASITGLQARVWGDKDLIALTWAQENPDSPRAVQQYADYLLRHGRAEDAINAFLEADARGVPSTDFPLQAALLSCRRGNLLSHPDLVVRSIARAATGTYNTAALRLVSLLRKQVQSGGCPNLMNDSAWLRLTDALLNNPNFQRVGAGSSYLRVERAYYWAFRRDLDRTMTEFELAYQAKPSIPLSRLIASTLLSAGLKDEAIKWLRTGLLLKESGLRHLFALEHARSQRMLAAIEKEDSTQLEQTREDSESD